MSIVEIVALIVSGILVGFINTLAGGGTIISLSVFMFMGLSPGLANGTNRIAVTLQNLVAVNNFRKNKVLDVKKGAILAIPTVIGSIIGAKIAVKLDENIIKISFAIIMIAMLFILFFNTEKWTKGNSAIYDRPFNYKTYIYYFLIGLYGGYVHAGIGYLLIAALLLHNGYDLVKGNALKNFLVLCYVPFTLLVFVLQDQVNWKYGLVHSIGNIIGAYIGSSYAVRWGNAFIRWVMVVVIVISIADLLNIINIKDFIKTIMSN